MKKTTIINREEKKRIAAEKKRTTELARAEKKRATELARAEKKRVADEKKRATDLARAEKKRAADRVLAEKKRATDRALAEKKRDVDFTRKTKGMKASSAQRVKKLGHDIEDKMALALGGKVIKGTRKPNIVNENGFYYSCKRGKKTQFALYSKDKIASIFGKNSVFYEYLSVFPDLGKTKESKERKFHLLKTEYKIVDGTKYREIDTYKHKLSMVVDKMYRHLSNKRNLYFFLNSTIFGTEGDEVDFIILYDERNTSKEMCDILSIKSCNSYAYIIHKKDFLDVMVDNLIVDKSKATDPYIGSQKVIMKLPNKETSCRNVMEIEIRSDSPSHFNQFLFHGYKNLIQDFVVNHWRKHLHIDEKQKIIFVGPIALQKKTDVK